MVERGTPKRSATSFLGMPRSMAASVFNLRSFEYAFMESMLVQVRYLRKPLSEIRVLESPHTRSCIAPVPILWADIRLFTNVR
jgi:hypothetical protein